MSISNQLTSRWEIDQLVKTRLFTDEQAVLRSARRVSFMRDLTRGGLATVLNEATGPGRAGMLLREVEIPVREQVRSICEVLGLEPLYLACEGRLAAIVGAVTLSKKDLE